MCGIFGVYAGLNSTVAPAIAVRALQTLQHRGPDDHGVLGWCGQGAPQVTRDAAQLPESNVLLVHRRLSILDLSTAGWQPMLTADQRYAIVFNGEIYNYIELRAELEQLGHHFHSSSDTEVLLHGYAQWGSSILPRLIGMFAFAILDTHRRVLFVARDFFGIKPLYYTQGPGVRFAFASEIKALLELDTTTRRANPARIQQYLVHGRTDDGDDTFFADIRQLRPGHWIEIPLDGSPAEAPKEYWRLAPTARRDLTFAQAAEAVRELFLQNIRLHLRSDVPIGAALSGGIDSSAIVAGMRHVEPSLELHTFTYAADDPAVSEKHWADIARSHAAGVQHLVRAQPSELLQDLEALIRGQDEPFASTSIYAQHRVFKAAREAGITVMLDGQGADELLGGYWPYVLSRIGSLAASGNWFGAAQLVASAYRRGHVPHRSLLTSSAGLMLPSVVRSRARAVVKRKQDLPPWLDSEWFEARAIPLSHAPLTRESGMLTRHLIDSVYSGLPALLRYEDRNSMAHSIESRVPFLTQDFSELVLSLPEEYLIAADGTTKAVFRQAMRGIVPDRILGRTDKIGFATPESQWLLSAEWVEGLLATGADALPVFRAAEVHSAWQDSRTRGTLAGPVWRWINLIKWSEAFEVTYD